MVLGSYLTLLMENIEVPEYFICPISLQIMKDPVTAISGITYERKSIEHWLFKCHHTICPVTKKNLPKDSDLTPNHTLRRLIQAWCTVNAANGIDRIPITTEPPLDKFYVINLIRDLCLPNVQRKTLQQLEVLAMENDRNGVYMVEAGLVTALISFIISCYRKGETTGLEEALSVFYHVRNALGESTWPLMADNDEIVDSLIWILGSHILREHVQAACALKEVVQHANPGIMDRLKPEFFKVILSNIKGGNISQQGRNILLQVLLEACPLGRNRILMVEFGAVFELLEIELKNPEKKTTELVLGILYHLCCCADGRAQFLNHAAGIAVITTRILKVSSSADDRAVLIIWHISKSSATKGVLQEMLRVGTVAKLCILMQANCGSHLKEKAREILRTHTHEWKDSPCIEVPTLTVYTR